MTMTRRLILSALFLLGIVSMAAPAEAADPRFPKRAPVQPPSGTTWVNTTVLEIVGAAFPTLPEPYLSIEIATVSGIDGAPAAEAKAISKQRVTMTAAEAAQLRDALEAWLTNPNTTSTLMVKSY